MIKPDPWRRCLRGPATFSRRLDAFTLVECVVVVITLSVLAMVIFPALASVAVKGGRTQCAGNLRQIGMASMLYANENNTWLPACALSAHAFNELSAVHYARYVWFSTTPGSYRVPTNATPASNFQNLGYLYRAGLAGNGECFFCPAQVDPNSFLNADTYAPLLTAVNTGSSIIESSYLYNLRTVSSGPTRKYQQTTQLEPHKLFAVDDFENINPLGPPHYREGGWNVLFTDGSVQFTRSGQVCSLINLYEASPGRNISWSEGNHILDYIESDH